MSTKANDLRQRILEVVREEPLETKEIEELLQVTRAKVLYQLLVLRGDGLVQGKQVGAGKGTWIWWQAKK